MVSVYDKVSAVFTYTTYNDHKHFTQNYINNKKLNSTEVTNNDVL